MKKIIFVQKEDSNYDPVSVFFNKKPPSVPKSLNSTNKSSNVKPVSDIKPASQIQKNQKSSIVKKQDEPTAKIGKKGQYQVPNVPKPYPLKQQVLKSRDLSRTNVKKQSKVNILKQQIPKLSSQKQFKQMVQKEDSIQKMKQQEQVRPVKKEKVETIKNESLSNRIKQLEQREQEYQRKIEQLQASRQQYVKNQQKLLKIQKDFKALTQKSRQAQAAQQKLKQRQAEIKQMLQGNNSIPFNRKRQVILNNKIKQLKRLNKELILRIKNYKGSDLVDLSIQQNRQEITKDLYTVNVQKQLNAQMNAEMESLLMQLITKLKSYAQSRIKEKGERLLWSNEQKFLLQISNLSEKISLNYLNSYELTPFPNSNEEAVCAYSILEQYKKSNEMSKVVDRFQLNWNLSKQNMQVIKNLDSMNQETLKLKAQINKSKNRRQDPAKLKQFLKIVQKRNAFLQILAIQNICEVEHMKNWLQKATSKLAYQIGSTAKHLQQLKNIVQLGPSAKESLFVYLQANLQRLSANYSSLKYQLRKIGVDFQRIQNCASLA